MTKAEMKANEAYPENGSDNWIPRPFFEEGYAQAMNDAYEWLANYAFSDDEGKVSKYMLLHDFMKDNLR